MGNTGVATRINQQVAAHPTLNPNPQFPLLVTAASLSFVEGSSPSGFGEQQRFGYLHPSFAGATLCPEAAGFPTLPPTTVAATRSGGFFSDPTTTARSNGFASTKFLQQQLADLQANFQQQIAALGAALSSSPHLGQSTINSGVSSDLLMYPKNLVTVFPTLATAPYLSGQMGNSSGLIVGEKLNGQNYFSWSQSVKIVLSSDI